MQRKTKKNANISSLAILKRFYGFLDPASKKLLIIGIIFALFSAISTISATLLTGQIVTLVFEPVIFAQKDLNLKLFIILSTAMLLLNLAYAIFGYLQNRLFVKIAYLSAKKMRQIAMNKLLYMPIAFYDEEQAGDLISTLVNDISNSANAITRFLTQVFTNVFSIIFTFIAMCFISSTLTIIILILAILLMSISVFMTKKARPALIGTQNAFGDLNAYLEEMLNNAKITQTFDAQEPAQIKFNNITDKIYKNAFVGDFFQRIFDPWFIFASNFIVISAILLALIFKNNNISVYGISYSKPDSGFVIALISLIYGLMGTIQVLITMVLSMQLGFASSTRVFRLVDLIIPEEETNTIKLDNPQGLINFNSVSFKYNKNSFKYQLENASFYAKSGQTIAIVGPTGAGKTTIINLLSRFYEYDQGSITIDNIELKKINKHDLRDIMAVVLQDSFMFNDTILNNLKIAKPNATKEEIEEVIKLVAADSFIARLKNGYDTILENNGNNLSQGEKQLLAIARAILGNKKILILDEATSNVDSNTEKIIQNALQNSIMKNKTSIVIAHRLSTIRNANLILVVNAGKIIEKGTHEELMESKGYYWNLYTSQFN
ncbi:ABC transporter ATP-binding protein [Mycoplasma sp. 1018B]|uniref:ABC transporter ATP-binding protein n=1 Tax=Mycoplasma sp. 1018B TaxID=2967302 RepID=UPI00211CC925|nr:ABC transporter ATP-binding protein [Mycoplasma sp. 1018B]UUM19394.1 ABC transporter ATP-binding protein/permease [Mycoplasma sp. 1018B]